MSLEEKEYFPQRQALECHLDFVIADEPYTT